MPTSDNTKKFGLFQIMMVIIILTILVAGFASVMINHNKGFKIEYNLTQLQRKGGLGNSYFLNALRTADYRISSSVNNDNPFQDYQNIIPTEAKIVGGTTVNMNNSDTITVTYTVNKDNMFNCLAENVPLNSVLESILFVTENQELACAPVKDKLPNTVYKDILVEGVEAMRIRYGEDTDHDGIANRYVAADFPGLSLGRVINIKLSLLLRTPEKANLVLDSKYYTLQDVELGPYNDKYVRKVYTTVIPISSGSATNKP